MSARVWFLLRTAILAGGALHAAPASAWPTLPAQPAQRSAGAPTLPGDGGLRLEYAAPPQCPAAAEVRAHLTQRIRLTGQHLVRMSLVSAGDRVVGRLWLDEDERSQREISGARCEDVVHALALIAALALDRAGAGAAPPAGLAPAPDPPAPPAPPPARRPASAAAPRSSTAREPRWQWHALTAGLLTRGVSPKPMVAALAGARVERRRLFHGWLAVAIGAHTSATEQGEVSFLWTTARGGLCWNLDPEDLWAELCADVDVGRLRVEAAHAVRATTARRLWLGAGGHVGLAWPKTSRAFVQLQAGLLAPLLRDHVYLTPNVNVHTTPAVVPWTTLGVGVRFP
ncbi:MAG: hypothetical protein IPI49_07235 [Myxococcales bacterium]|nr:hypothetical protein [Myxococcales bacterium]